MFTLAKFVLKSYMPKQLEKGMWFISKQKDVVYGQIYEYIKVYELKEVPQDMNSYIAVNGAPVEPYIVQVMNNPDDKEYILATPDQIGWWDDGDNSDDLEDITVTIINDNIYGENGNDGHISVEMIEDEDGDRHLVLFHGKVTIRHCELVDDYLEEYDDYEEEDWDDMDDNPEEE
jgi:hypothetical protein